MLAVDSTYAIGIDVGGTKIAAGLINVTDGTVLARVIKPTEAGRGGEAVLKEVISLAANFQSEAAKQRLTVEAVGLGVAELVDLGGQILSGATIQWNSLPVVDRVRASTGLTVRVEADVRAAAFGEARFGAGLSVRSSFLYVTIGTGISSCLVIEGVPFQGARGLTGTFASGRGMIPSESGDLVEGPPLEQFASGPALASRYAAAHPAFTGAAGDVLALATGGDDHARRIVESAGHAVGAAVAHLVNVLDPERVIIGGGLGLAGGLYQSSIEAGLRLHVWSKVHRDIPLCQARLGQDAGMIGAALAAVDALSNSAKPC